MSIAYIFKSTLTVGDHTGYCSGDECKDEISKNYYAFIINIDDTKMLIDDNLFIEPYFYERCSEHFNTRFSTVKGYVGCGGSGYCGSSPSGLKHEYSLKLKLHKIVRPEEVKSHKYATLIDENDAENPLNEQLIIEILIDDTKMLIDEWLI